MAQTVPANESQPTIGTASSAPVYAHFELLSFVNNIIPMVLNEVHSYKTFNRIRYCRRKCHSQKNKNTASKFSDTKLSIISSHTSTPAT